jgi:hypothetical protein
VGALFLRRFCFVLARWEDFDFLLPSVLAAVGLGCGFG